MAKAAGVDVTARRRAAQILRDFLGGKLTNDAFDDALPKTGDASVHAVWASAWVFYDDFTTHRLTGKHRLHPDQRRACLRWVLFLDGDLPYIWPHLPIPAFPPMKALEPSRLMRPVRRLFGEAMVPGAAVRQFMAARHFPVWPFASVAEYKAALAHPRRLRG